MDNIWEYLEKDFWDIDDLKFDFWTRMSRHQMIVNEVFQRNGVFDKPHNHIEGKTLLEMRDIHNAEDDKIKITSRIEYTDEFIKFMESTDDE